MLAPSRTIELTRESLHEQVWSEPMARRAERYGISDVALAKTCRKLVIPVPARGYWRRKETGRAPARLPLPRPRPGARTTVTLSLERRREPAPRSPDVAAREAHEALPENRIQVADRLSHPHPLVRETAAILRDRSDRHDPVRPRRVDPCLNIRVTPKNLGRALHIFDAFAKALEARGVPVSVVTGDSRQTQVELFGEKVAFWIEERPPSARMSRLRPGPRTTRAGAASGITSPAASSGSASRTTPWRARGRRGATASEPHSRTSSTTSSWA